VNGGVATGDDEAFALRGQVEVDGVRVDLRLQEGDRLDITARAFLRHHGQKAASVELIDPLHGEISEVRFSAGRVERHRGDYADVLLLNGGTSGIRDGDYVDMRVQFPKSGETASPVCVLPSHLLQLRTESFQDAGGEHPYLIREPRLELSQPWLPPHGSVRTADGELLAIAAPYTRVLLGNVIHADESLVLCGQALARESKSHQRTIIDRHLDILRFLNEELGGGDRVTALGVYDVGSSRTRFRLESGHLSMLEAQYLQVVGMGYMAGERLIARELASIWWRHGVRPSGDNAAGFALSLSAYLVLRWFETKGDTESLQSERAFLMKVATKLAAERGGPRHWEWLGAELAIRLHDASKRGAGLRMELRRWCAEDWGNAVSTKWLSERLQSCGVSIPGTG
jgi:hypothetical protein